MSGIRFGYCDYCNEVFVIDELRAKADGGVRHSCGRWSLEEKLRIANADSDHYRIALSEALKERDDARAEVEGWKDNCKFLLSLAPVWAQDVPVGLDATMYGTSTMAGDQEIMSRVDAIKVALGIKEKP